MFSLFRVVQKVLAMSSEIGFCTTISCFKQCLFTLEGNPLQLLIFLQPPHSAVVDERCGCTAKSWMVLIDRLISELPYPGFGIHIHT
ncbi:hypothetical protein PISMIDRAFT_276775 [Pisolithus microcarpus 441]|uniref:Unplaced genomic scaffold scaffold_181, whole genome shotgun sequence n=1 Tax=Pisolithus microcarpus 441 TaxID=765257 RepID=A0A0C9XUV7_9AGAM|nr:hypothetical protein PISMIDRAFT_276775 [Pisolithus microcarpus 441]